MKKSFLIGVALLASFILLVGCEAMKDDIAKRTAKYIAEQNRVADSLRQAAQPTPQQSQGVHVVPGGGEQQDIPPVQQMETMGEIKFTSVEISTGANWVNILNQSKIEITGSRGAFYADKISIKVKVLNSDSLGAYRVHVAVNGNLVMDEPRRSRSLPVNGERKIAFGIKYPMSISNEFEVDVDAKEGVVHSIICSIIDFSGQDPLVIVEKKYQIYIRPYRADKKRAPTPNEVWNSVVNKNKKRGGGN